MFSKTEMSDVLTEICKIDPNFNIDKFILWCQFTVIPNVLEVGILGFLFLQYLSNKIICPLCAHAWKTTSWPSVFLLTVVHTTLTRG